jgi:hypothetical protein
MLLGGILLAAGCATLQERTPEPAAVGPAPVREERRWTPDPSRPGPAIDRTGVRPKRFDPHAGPAVISFELAGGAVESEVAIRSESGQLARLLPVESTGAGRHSVRWDGTSDAGDALPSGVYTYEVRARDAAGGISVWSGEGAGPAEILPKAFTYDPASGALRYLLPRAGRVRLRAGISGLPFVATLLDWEPQEAGRHELVWDGRDGDRVFDLRRDPRVELVMHAYELEANTVLLDRDGGVLGRGEKPGASRGFRHARHAASGCRDFALQLELPEVERRGPDGWPVVSGEETLRVSLDPADADRLIGVGFEVLVFVDTVFVHQEPEGSTPFNYRLDAASLAPGPHVVTVNVLSTDDHAGLASLAFVVQ